jgi:hypothetical protein
MKPTAPPAPATMKVVAKNAKTNSQAVSTARTVKPKPKAPRPAKPAAAGAAKRAKTPAAPVAQAKTIPVKSAKTAPATKSNTENHAVKVVTESVFEGGALWKMSGKNGVAYVKDAALAGELLATDPKNLAKRAMAVYYDKKGKAFAWQVRFDTDRWEEVLRRLG